MYITTIHIGWIQKISTVHDITMGVEFGTKIIQLKQEIQTQTQEQQQEIAENIKLQIWDTVSTQENDTYRNHYVW